MDGSEEYGRSPPLGLMGFLDEGGLLNEGVLFNDDGLPNEGDFLLCLWVIRRLIPTMIKAIGMKRYMIGSILFILNKINGRGTSLSVTKIVKPNHLFTSATRLSKTSDDTKSRKLWDLPPLDPWLSVPSSRMVWPFGNTVYYHQ
jgi:hypothetical protein